MRDDFCGISQFDTLIPRKYLIHDDIQSSQCHEEGQRRSLLPASLLRSVYEVSEELRIITLQLCVVHSSSLSDR